MSVKRQTNTKRVQFIAPYMAYNPGEIAAFTEKAAMRLINSKVAEEATDKAIKKVQEIVNAKNAAPTDATPGPEITETAPKKRRRGSSEASAD